MQADERLRHFSLWVEKGWMRRRSGEASVSREDRGRISWLSSDPIASGVNHQCNRRFAADLFILRFNLNGTP